MAKFSAYYRLCPLIDQKTFIGVSDEPVNGCVIITLGKNMVIRYKLSNQQQVNSWSSRDKLTAPVVYDTVSQKYIGVFNNNQISTWEESCVELNNLKKFKFATTIEYILTSAHSSTPLVVFRNGHISTLQQALDRRKELFPSPPLLSKEESICEAHLVSVMGILLVVVFTTNIKNEYNVYLTPVEEGVLGQSHFKMARQTEEDVKLISYTLINYETCQLLTLWSDGKLFSLELPISSSEQFPGKYLSTITAINPRYQTAMLPLSTTHLAIYGADKNDEGALLFIFNTQLCVCQCKQAFKLYTSPARLWKGGQGSVLLADGQYLLVVPYHLGQQRLAELLGSQDSDTKPLPNVLWDNQEHNDTPSTSSLDETIQSYMNEGLSQRTICQNLFLPFVDANDVEGLKGLMAALSDIPESCIISVLAMCLEDLSRPGNRDLLRKALTLPVTPDLGTLRQLRERLGVGMVLSLLHELSDGLMEGEAAPRLVEWATLLLDAYYQQYLLSRDENVIKTLTELKAVVEKKMEEITVWQQLDSLVLQLQSRQDFPESTCHNNNIYCIEKIKLY